MDYCIRKSILEELEAILTKENKSTILEIFDDRFPSSEQDVRREYEKQRELIRQIDSIKIGKETLLDVVNLCLDVIGIFDPSGIADMSNALIYARRGLYSDAIISVIGALLPVVGDLLKARKFISPEVYKQIIKVLDSEPAKKLMNHIQEQGYSEVANALKQLSEMDEVVQIERYIDGITRKTSTKPKEYINKKMVETTSAFTLKGQKKAFQVHPILKSLEVGLAGFLIKSAYNKQDQRIAEKYMREVKCKENDGMKSFCSDIVTHPGDLSVASKKKDDDDVFLYLEERDEVLENGEASKWFREQNI